MLPDILVILLAAAPIRTGATIRARKKISDQRSPQMGGELVAYFLRALRPSETDRILVGTTVFLKMRPDTIPIGYADSGLVLLAKIKDSSYVLPDKKLLTISELAIRRAQEILPVTEETWIASKQGIATVDFGFRSRRGTTDAFRAHLDTAGIERIFVPDLIPDSSKRIALGTKVLIVFAAALVGGTIGVVYGKAHSDQDGSTPGSAAFYLGLAGMLIGRVYGFQFAFLDG